MYLRDMPLPSYMLTHHGDLNLMGLDHTRALRAQTGAEFIVVRMADNIADYARLLVEVSPDSPGPFRTAQVLSAWSGLVHSTTLDSTQCDVWAQHVSDEIGYSGETPLFPFGRPDVDA